MSPFTKVNPLTTWALLLALGFGVAFVTQPWPLLALHACLVAAVVGSGCANLRQVAVTHLRFAPFAVGVLMTNAVSRGGAVVAQWGPWEVTDDGVRVGAALAIRVLLVAVPAVAVASATDPTRLVNALMQHLRLPSRGAFAVLTAHRLLSGLPDRWRSLLNAALVRAPLRRGRPHLGVRGYRRAAFSLLVVSIRDGDRVADALDVRGIGAPGRTVRTVVGFGVVDVVAVVLVVGLATLVWTTWVWVG